MRARIWGCRGSLAAPGPHTVRYGGNTSCVELRLDDGTLIMLDAGTGMLPFSSRGDYSDLSEIHLFLTHLHLDHIQGLGFFPPLWDSGVKMQIWGPPSPVESLDVRLGRYLSPPLFPLQIAGIGDSVEFKDAPEGRMRLGSAEILTTFVSHSGPTVGYRIEENGHSLTYIPDHEPAHGKNLDDVAPEWMSGFDLAHRTDVLLHDSQYTEQEYPERIGWGHSSVAHAVKFANKAEARRLVMFHHDPQHTDTMLEQLHERACKLWEGNGQLPELAFESQEISFD